MIKRHTPEEIQIRIPVTEEQADYLKARGVSIFFDKFESQLFAITNLALIPTICV
jgi:hypothetical protein